MSSFQRAVTRPSASVLETNKVLRSTYMLLSATLLFSAAMAGVSIVVQPPAFTGIICSLVALALIWLVLPKTANSTAGLGVVFAITGLLGFGLGPLLSAYLTAGAGNIVALALGGTGVVFIGLSAYAITSKRDFSFMGGMLVAGLIVVLIAAIANIFLQIPALSATVSSVIILIMSGFILYDTGRIVNGGETNYITATVSMYLSIYNIFVSLLQLLGMFGGDD